MMSLATRIASERRLALYESMGLVYAGNYRLLLRLVPDLTERRRAGPLSVEGLPDVHLALTGCSRYTSFLRLTHELGDEGVPDLIAEIRVYHDVRLAEIVSYQGQGHFRPRYPQPNRHMYLVHEKQLVNHFLHEWLRNCLVRQARRADAASG